MKRFFVILATTAVFGSNAMAVQTVTASTAACYLQEFLALKSATAQVEQKAQKRCDEQGQNLVAGLSYTKIDRVYCNGFQITAQFECLPDQRRETE